MSPADPLSSMNTPIIQYFEVLLALGGVLALAYATLKIGLPRIFGMRTPGTGPIKVVARYTLEPRKTLYLVQAGLAGLSARHLRQPGSTSDRSHRRKCRGDSTVRAQRRTAT